MNYNFNEIHDRTNSNCLKWDGIEERFDISSENLLPLWVADMDFKAPNCILDSISKKNQHGIFGYSGDFNSYYDAIILWMKKRHQWDIKKDWIVYTPGVVCALNIIVKTFTNPGDKVIIQSPVYPPFSKSIENNKCEVIDNPLVFDGNNYTMDFENLKSQIDEKVKLLILCSPHNPVGRVWTKSELQKLGDICLKNNIIVVSDEIHNDLILNDNEHTSFALVNEDFAQNSIICTAPSKTFNIAGLQTSNIIIKNKKLRDQFLITRESCGISKPNTFGMEALKAAYTQGDDWLNHLLIYLNENLNFLIDYINKYIPKIKVVKPQATYLVWLNCNGLNLSDEALENFIIKDCNLLLNQGYTYGNKGSGFVRINIACPLSVLKEALIRLKNAVDEKL